MITVACVLKSGGRYDSTWVDKLQNGVARHLSVAHKFVCLSDVPVHCDRIPLAAGLPGWWSKIELFRPGALEGRVLYLDLDTVVVGGLDVIASYAHKFTMVHEYYRPQFACSTAMAWEGDYSYIWSTLCRQKNPTTMMREYDTWTSDQRIGDQAFIEDCLKTEGRNISFFRDLFGERSIASYKVHCKNGLQGNEAAVAFHGSLKPDKLGHVGWIKENWT